MKTRNTEEDDHMNIIFLALGRFLLVLENLRHCCRDDATSETRSVKTSQCRHPAVGYAPIESGPVSGLNVHPSLYRDGARDPVPGQFIRRPSRSFIVIKKYYLSQIMIFRFTALHWALTFFCHIPNYLSGKTKEIPNQTNEPYARRSPVTTEPGKILTRKSRNTSTAVSRIPSLAVCGPRSVKASKISNLLETHRSAGVKTDIGNSFRMLISKIAWCPLRRIAHVLLQQQSVLSIQ
jgi:hypothetical protein